MSKVGEINYVNGVEVVSAPGEFKLNQQINAIRAGMLGTRSTGTDRVSVVPAQTLNSQPTINEITRNITSVGQPIPLVYGHAQVAGKVFALDYTDGTWTVGYTACLGEIESIVRVLLNDEAPVSGVTVNTYTGTTSQTADPLLSAAISGYSDNLVISRGGSQMGIVYIVVQFTTDHYADWPRVVIEVQGRKVYNPKTTLTEYSENPALHLGDLLASDCYGHGYTVDATTLEAAQDYCDQTTLGETRRRSFSVFDRIMDTDQAVDVLRTYASCFLSFRGDTVRLIPDKAESSVRSFTASDIIRGSLKIRKADSANLPTVVRVEYTDKTGDIWRTRVADEAQLPGVEAGTTPRRVSTINLAGVGRHSQAYREAVERLNKLQLSDLSVTFQTFDEALALEVGDVITVTHPYGLTNKLFRITSEPQQSSPGRWTINAAEYDPAAYSDEVVAQPTYTDGNLPSGQAPSAPSGLTVGETTYQLQNGKYVSRLDVSWTASSDIFVTSYSVNVTDNLGAVVYSANTGNTAVATPPLRELVPYTVSVRALTPTQQSDVVTGSISIIGKTAIPDAPASLSGFEAGGEVRLSWPPSNDIDAERYEVRYGLPTGDWGSAQVIDIVDGLRLTTREVPAGTWRFYVKTIDSINQYSTSAATLDVVVTLDNDAFLAGQLDPVTTHSGLSNMHETVEVRGGAPVYYSDGGDTWMLLFPNAMNTYTDPLASYQSPVAAEWLGEELDLIQNQTGTFQATLPTTEVYTGTPFQGFQLKPDGGSYSDQVGLSAKTSARYARLKVSGTSLFKVTMPSGSIRADILAQEETGAGTSAASGATTITLSRQYAAARSLVITPEATSARSAVYDNIVLDNSGVTTFDVYIFNSAGTQVATPFRYSFKGV